MYYESLINVYNYPNFKLSFQFVQPPQQLGLNIAPVVNQPLIKLDLLVA